MAGEYCGAAMGFDGGGTKTHCVILDTEGKVQGTGEAGPSNPLRSGFDAAFRELRAAADEARQSAHLQGRDIGTVCAGLAGASLRQTRRRALLFLAHEFPDATAQVATDAEIALEAGVGSAPGVVLVAGTGSSACGRNAAGETARAGEFGRWIGDEGSAYEIGRSAVAAVARARDYAAPVTLLADMIAAALESPSWDDLLERIAAAPDDVFLRIFPVVVAADEAEDSAAREILFTAALGLAGLALSVVRQLGLANEEFMLVKSGVVVGASTTLDAAFDSVFASGAPRARISRLEISPAVGAARMAARLAAPEETPAEPRRMAHGA